MKRYFSFVYSVSALVMAVSVVGCNDTAKDIHSNKDPQPGSAPVCPETSLQVMIAENAATRGVSAFGSNPLVVPVGGTVTWMNHDTVPHTATSDTEVWDTDVINPGESSAPVQFAKEGTFPYYCRFNGKEAMSGVIQVVPLPAGCSVPVAIPSGAPGAVPSGTPNVNPGA